MSDIHIQLQALRERCTHLILHRSFFLGMLSFSLMGFALYAALYTHGGGALTLLLSTLLCLMGSLGAVSCTLQLRRTEKQEEQLLIRLYAEQQKEPVL